MANVDGALQVQRLDEDRQVVGVGVHVVAGPGLARPTVAAPVVGDAAITVLGEEQHLVLEGVRAQRPAVAEHHGLPLAPVLVIELHAVFGGDRAHGHASVREPAGRTIRPSGNPFYAEVCSADLSARTRLGVGAREKSAGCRSGQPANEARRRRALGRQDRRGESPWCCGSRAAALDDGRLPR